jgi:hypothetical protein
MPLEITLTDDDVQMVIGASPTQYEDILMRICKLMDDAKRGKVLEELFTKMAKDGWPAYYSHVYIQKLREQGWDLVRIQEAE